MLKRYGKIVGAYEDTVERYSLEAFRENFILEEKVDGSQFRARLEPNGVMYFGSKNVEFDETHIPSGEFKLAITQMTTAFEKLKGDGKTYDIFAEYLSAPKHNTLKYERIPKNNLYLFDAMVNGEWLNESELIALANKMELEPPNLVAEFNKFPTKEDVDEFLIKPSILGGITEGVILKNRSVRYDYYGAEAFLTVKSVKTEFKELNREVWQKERKGGIRSIGELVGATLEAFSKKSIWLKSIQHLQDNGERTYTMRDMMKLVELVEEDMELEYKQEIMEFLYKTLKAQLKRELLKGLPEFYKDQLYNEVRNKVINND